MKWFSKKKTETTTETKSTVVITPSTDLRAGMWVNAQGRIGILTNFSNGMAEVTYTKGDGSTLMVMDANEVVVPAKAEYPLEQLRQATVGEIPRNRYESVEQLKALGYGD